MNTAAPLSGRVPRRIAAVLINSLKGGVVPRLGLPYITVGRTREVEALVHDLSLVGDGGASCRFVVGRYGAGKSFLLQAIRTHALGRGFAVVDADLSPTRRFRGSAGHGLATYRELVKNLSTKTRPEGGALPLVLERWAAAQTDRLGIEGARSALAELTHELEDLVGGFDAVRVLSRWWEAREQGQDEIQACAIKWLRGEYRTAIDAYRDLGVRACITDDSWFDYLKILARLLVLAGYQGLLVLIDELDGLHKIPHGVSRHNNYEAILSMYNETLQGRAQHLGLVMAGTPESVEDPHRGLFSHAALKSRLAQGSFASEGLPNVLAPVIKLDPLTNEELLVLLEKIAQIHADYFEHAHLPSTEQIGAFLQAEQSHVGASTHRTPREVVRDFIEMLDVVYQNPRTNFDQLIAQATPGAAPAAALDDPFANAFVDLRL